VHVDPGKGAAVSGPFSPIVVLVGRVAAQLIQIFALYVIFHGHYSPGGGFQGGALLAASILLLRMIGGRETSQANFPSRWGPRLGAAGALVFLAIGAVAMLGGNYLDYARLGGGGAPAMRAQGILMVEIGIALAVMGTLVAIYDTLTAEG
jgi:multicomponent Na+:H+ antiporter subunit B